MPTTEASRPGHTARPVLRRAAPPVAIAAIAWLLGARHLAAAALIAGTLLTILAFVAPEATSTIDRSVRRAAERIGHLAGQVLLSAIWALVVFPVWAIGSAHRRLRHRPTLAAAGWRAVHTDPSAAPARTFNAPPNTPAGASVLLRLASLAVAVLLGAVGALYFWPERTVDRTRAPAVIYRPQVFEPEDQARAVAYAFADDPWADQAIYDAGKTSAIPDPVVGWRGRDVQTQYVNIVDGHRVSYAPENPTLTVWFFGGSTMFGDGQRDEHTIPSEVARLAEAEGVSIRAVNFGAGSYNNFQGTMWFLDALTREAPPDVAVFYDGANEWSTALERVNYGELDPERIYYQAVNEEERAARQARAPEVTLDAQEQAEAAIDLAAEQYRRGAEIARWAGAANDVEVIHVWQPGLWSTPIQPFAQPLLELLASWGVDEAMLAQLEAAMAEVREKSGIDPIDLSDALADVDQPTLFDLMHTNELGARVIAEDLFEYLRPALGGD